MTIRPASPLNAALFLALFTACGGSEPTEAPGGGPGAAVGGGAPEAGEAGDESAESGAAETGVAERYRGLRGDVTIDGSSTVYPITEAATRAFRRRAPGVHVHLGVSGTGGGFRKFCRGELDVSDASRPINEREAVTCRENGVDFIEVPIAFDGVSVVVHPDNHWSSCVTVAELGRLWQPASEGRIERWSQLRPGWPEEPIELFAPGRDSGTFDYFTTAVVGEEGACRADFVGSEDDYLLAQDVARHPLALGFFGYAYYREYQDRLRLVAIDSGAGCVAPSEETIVGGSYRPLSRPIFFYLSATAVERPEVRTFVDFFLEHAEQLVRDARYVPLPAEAYRLASRRVAERRTGSLFDGGSQVGVSVEELLRLETDR